MNDLQITYFLALCKYNNFSETARQLYTSQPTISKQISALEDELGVSLFKREYKNVCLTEEGKILRHTLELTVQMIQNAKTKMYQISHPEEYILKIGVIQGFDITNLIKPALLKFLNLYPNIYIFLECLSHQQLNSMIRLNELDLALTLFPEVCNDRLLETRKLFCTKLAFTVHASHPLYNAEKISRENLEGQTLLITTKGTRTSSSFINLLYTHYHITPDQLLFLSSLDEVISYTCSGSGVSILPVQKRLSTNPYRQFPAEVFIETISAAWYYKNNNPARTIFLNEIKTAE